MKLYLKSFFNLLFFYCVFFNIFTAHASNINQSVTEWELVSLENTLNSNDDYLRADKLQRIKIKFDNDNFFIDDQLIATKKFTLSDINDEMLSSISRKLNEDELNNYVYYHINLSNNNYQLAQLIIASPHNNALFLSTNDGFILSFKPKLILQNEFSTLFSNLAEIKLPIKRTFLIKEDDFTPLPDYFTFYLGEKYDSNIFQAMKVKSNNDNYKLILLSSYDISGSKSLALISFSNKFKLIDKIILSEQYELENGHLDIDSSIDTDYLIKQKKIEYRDLNLPNQLNVKNYTIDNNGFFIMKIN